MALYFRVTRKVYDEDDAGPESPHGTTPPSAARPRGWDGHVVWSPSEWWSETEIPLWTEWAVLQGNSAMGCAGLSLCPHDAPGVPLHPDMLRSGPRTARFHRHWDPTDAGRSLESRVELKPFWGRTCWLVADGAALTFIKVWLSPRAPLVTPLLKN